MGLATRVLSAAILASVLLAAQAPSASDPTTPAPLETSEAEQNDTSNHENGAQAGDSTQGGNPPNPVDHEPSVPRGKRDWLILVFSGVLAVVATLQFWLAKQMFYSTHRPKLRVRNVVIPDLVKLFSNSASLKKQHEWTCDVVNVGGTPATLTFFNIHLDAMHHPDTEETIYRKPENQVNETIEIAAGESRKMNIPHTAFTDQDRARIQTHGKDRGLSDATDLDAYVVGVLKYKDKVGLERQTSIRRKFDRKELRFITKSDRDCEYED